ncbi:WXG100 family type VII secretion target [Nocardia huaxiensis]|uniref:WXG100 family type VII secretion target n=1 Tax=Nocardia huaxiensis TaxID=2755382 RepID=UPI001E4F7AFC|nr:WXG100 family type VII secretion target [Nocardia huaxiensis]UFS99125.1 WXG100 family type VII secretion target [Nocardia huaxiensis]
MSEFSVNLDELDNIVARLSALAGFLTEKLDLVDDKVATLAGTGWESVAAQAYTDAHRQWVCGAREFAEGVDDCSAAARTAHGRYSTAAEVNRQMLQGG